jgi:hypothetical protein
MNSEKTDMICCFKKNSGEWQRFSPVQNKSEKGNQILYTPVNPGLHNM